MTQVLREENYEDDGAHVKGIHMSGHIIIDLLTKEILSMSTTSIRISQTHLHCDTMLTYIWPAKHITVT